LFTSDTEIDRMRIRKTAFVYLLVSLFCVLFGAVYESYSHEVYSYYMIYAFVFPLAGGTLIFGILSFANINRYPNAVLRNLYHSGIAALTVGSLVQGVLDIYGTTNILAENYWYVGFTLVGASIIIFLCSLLKK